MQNRTFKIAFILAIIVHSIIIIMLSIKFTKKASHYSVMPVTGIIKATAISNNKTIAANPVKQSPPLEQIVEQKQEPKRIEEQALKQKADVEQFQIKTEKQYLVKNKLRDELKQQLLLEQKQELKELKKQAEKINKAANTQQQKLLQQMLSQELMAEKQQLSSTLAEASHGEVSSVSGLSGAQSGEVDKYKALLIQTIAAQWIVPDGVEKNIICTLLVNLAPGGEVLSVKLLSSSGNVALDRSAQTAVLKASPLPVPKESGLFNEFRELKLIVRPEGIVSN